MHMKPIELHGLTQEQVDMLDLMWAMSDLEEVEAWQATLSPQELEMSLSLQVMVLQEAAEQIMMDDVDLQAQAQAVIRRVMSL